MPTISVPYLLLIPGDSTTFRPYGLSQLDTKDTGLVKELLDHAASQLLCGYDDSEFYLNACMACLFIPQAFAQAPTHPLSR